MKLLYGRKLVFSLGFGFILSCLMVGLAFNHNSQSEFYLPDGSVDYTYCFELFTIWFLVGTVIGALISFLCWTIVKVFVRKRISDASQFNQ